jgi:Fe-S-cluster containining protein
MHKRRRDAACHLVRSGPRLLACAAAVPSPSSPHLSWKTDPHRRALLALYAEVDALLADFRCDASTECCQFGVTGREPYPTAVELAEVRHAIAAAGIVLARAPSAGGGRGRGDASSSRRGRALPVLDEARRCPLLSAEGRCRIYASRPFGCRTFFCDRATGPGKMPRVEIQRLSRDPHARPLTGALDVLRGR